jgi:hypothetical protein
MAAIASMKPGGQRAAQLTFPLIFNENFTAGRAFFPTAEEQPIQLLLGETFQSEYHAQKAADARQSVYDGLANDRRKEMTLLTSHANFRLPKPVLGQRKFANASLGAAGSSSGSARQDGPFGAPFQMIENEMVGGVMRTQEGFDYYTKNLQARIGQLNKMNTLTMGVPVERGAIIQPLSDSRFEGSPDKIEFFLLLQQLMDSVSDGDINRFSLDNLNKMIKTMFRFGPTADKEDFEDMVRAISEIRLQLDQGLPSENENYQLTLETYMERLAGYVDEMFANMNLSEKDRKTLSKSLVKTLQFNTLLREKEVRKVVNKIRKIDVRANQAAEDVDEDDDAPGGNGRFDQGGAAREDDEQQGVQRQAFVDAGQGGDPNREAYGAERARGAREQQEFAFFGQEPGDVPENAGDIPNQLAEDDLAAAVRAYNARFPPPPGGAAAAAAAAAAQVQPLVLADDQAAVQVAQEERWEVSQEAQRPVYAFIMEYGLDDGETRPTVDAVRVTLNTILENVGRDELIGFAQGMPPDVGGPYNPRAGTSGATIIKNILDRLKANEPTFR